MTDTKHQSLSRRERQIMDAVYRRGRASVGEVQEDLARSEGWRSEAQPRALACPD